MCHGTDGRSAGIIEPLAGRPAAPWLYRPALLLAFAPAAAMATWRGILSNSAMASTMFPLPLWKKYESATPILALMLAGFLFFAGHNQPGGGFAAGLVIGSVVVWISIWVSSLRAPAVGGGYRER